MQTAYNMANSAPPTPPTADNRAAITIGTTMQPNTNTMPTKRFFMAAVTSPSC